MLIRLTKAQRETVRLKFGGVCAYCGQPLPDRWHADHFQAVERWVGHKGNLIGLGRPERDTIDNFMPSCPPCNISKSSLTIEHWRNWLTGHVRSLGEHNTPYRLARTYGLIEETGRAVVFHFERIAAATGDGEAT